MDLAAALQVTQQRFRLRLPKLMSRTLIFVGAILGPLSMELGAEAPDHLLPPPLPLFLLPPNPPRRQLQNQQLRRHPLLERHRHIGDSAEAQGILALRNVQRRINVPSRTR